MTEDEAKTKWCPMVRNIAIGSTENIATGINRYNPRHPEEITGATCIGSACMMWREYTRFDKNNETDEISNLRKGGYCGLAGTP